MDFHVVAFDYRGYADSSTHIAPTETGVVKDARAVYEWLSTRAVGKVAAFSIFESASRFFFNQFHIKVVVWGHSLGTAISSHLVADLCQVVVNDRKLKGGTCDLKVDLCQEDQRPCALVLESPFNNIFDEVRNHLMGWLDGCYDEC